MLEREVPGARLAVDPAAGGRVAALTVGGTELLVAGTAADPPTMWGMFPMVPWAGRVRHGRFTFAGRTHQLPVNAPPHALHGTTFDRPWEVEADGSLVIDLGPHWPFPGHARQRFDLHPTGLTGTIEVHADRHAMPAQAGWHPWFRRPVRLLFAARSQYELDAEGIPTGRLVPPTPGPWDDCFTDLLGPPQLAWPDGPTVVVTSTCTHWVVFDRLDHGLCLEPQTGPPDGLTLAPRVVEPGAPLVASVTLRWG